MNNVVYVLTVTSRDPESKWYFVLGVYQTEHLAEKARDTYHREIPGDIIWLEEHAVETE